MAAKMLFAMQAANLLRGCLFLAVAPLGRYSFWRSRRRAATIPGGRAAWPLQCYLRCKPRICSEAVYFRRSRRLAATISGDLSAGLQNPGRRFFRPLSRKSMRGIPQRPYDMRRIRSTSHALSMHMCNCIGSTDCVHRPFCSPLFRRRILYEFHYTMPDILYEFYYTMPNLCPFRDKALFLNSLCFPRSLKSIQIS